MEPNQNNGGAMDPNTQVPMPEEVETAPQTEAPASPETESPAEGAPKQ